MCKVQASSSAIARPIPVDAPVTKAVLEKAVRVRILKAVLDYGRFLSFLSDSFREVNFHQRLIGHVAKMG